MREKVFFWGVLVCLTALGIVVVVVGLEMGLRVTTRLNYGGRYYPWPPFLSQVNVIDSGVFHGVSGEKKMVINSLGLRGEEMSAGDEYRLLAIGASTTEEGELDETETWSYLLGKRLNIWVGNAGRRGGNMRDMVLQMKYFVPQLAKIDGVIMLPGVNDFMIALDPKWQPQLIDLSVTFSNEQLDHAFYIHPRSRYGVKGMALWNVLKRAKVLILGRKWLYDRDSGKPLLVMKEMRSKAAMRNKLPDLTRALDEYRTYLLQVAKLAREQEIKLILLTQPFLWRENMPEEELQQLWFGCVNGEPYICYVPEVLAEGMREYNQVLLEVCAEEKLRCVDLANLLPQSFDYMHDDVHFSEAGARKVAEILAGELAEVVK